MEWMRGRTIGRGSTATVSVATARGSGEAVAVKSAEHSKSEALRREQEMLSSLRSPRVISYRGFRATAEGFELFMELAAGGSLADEIRRRGGSLGDAAARACAREILLGLDYLHSEGIVHCDVKASNVLLTGDGLKIADFGCARRSGHVDGGDSFGGTPAYMAPEVARGEAQEFPADVWAFGCTVMEMYTGRVSWLGRSDPVSGLYRVGFSGLGLELPGCVSEEGRDFLGRCLRREAAERWSARELLDHPFVAGACGSGFDVESPRSVLEGVVVEFGDSSDSGWEIGSDSPGERVRRLCWGEVDDWACEEGWVRVRGDWAEVGPESLCCDPESDFDCVIIDCLRSGENGKGQGSASGGVGDWKRGSLMVPSKCTTGHVFCDRLYFDYNELYCFLCIFGSLFFDLTVEAFSCEEGLQHRVLSISRHKF